MKIFHFFKKYGILRNNVYNKKFERGILMILSCQNICKTFVEKPVLQNISFHLNENDRLAISRRQRTAFLTAVASYMGGVL